MSLLRKALASLDEPHRRALLESHLSERVSRSIGRSLTTEDRRLPLSAVGLDSLKAVELQHGIELELGITIPMADVLAARNIPELAADVLERMLAPASNEARHIPATETTRLSRGQEALWFLQQLSPDSAAYNIAYALRIRSSVDPARLKRTFQVLVDLHSCLRTRFKDRNGRPWADIKEHEEVSFADVNAAGWSEARLQEYLVHQTYKPFDLEHGPLFTVHLLTRSTGEHVLLTCVHHICVDFWSLVVLMDEMGRLYAAEDPEVEQKRLLPPARYADFVRWQGEMLGSEVGQKHEAYWLKQLSGRLPVLDLPTDRPRPATQTYRGASHSFQLDGDVTSALRSLAQQQQATLYTLLLAAFQSLLHRYTGGTDVLTGSPMAGRSRAEFGGVVGYFTNMVALRGDLSGDPAFTELLARTRSTVLGALAHQDFPFAILVDRLEQSREPSRSPVFQTAFVLEKPHIRPEFAEFVLGESGAAISLGNLQLESLALEQRVAQFDLTLMMVEAAGGLRASIQYNADLFDPSTIARLATHFQTLVQGIVANPRQRLSELPLLSREEHQQLSDWKGAAAREISPATTLQGLFEEQVERTPDAVAVVWDDQQLTYCALNRRANQLAHYLRERGVGPEALIGICLDRSPDMIVAVLAILKAGGAYFPLDPSYPEQRLSFMLRDGQVRLVLTTEQLGRHLPEDQVRVVALDPLRSELSKQSDENPASSSTAQNLAYVMYTSGSTGTPNGVAVCQQSVIRLVQAPDYVELTEDDVVLQFAPHTFDAATFEVWGSLLHGGRLVLLPHEKPSLEQFSDALARHRVSTLWLTSGLFHQMVDHDVAAFGSVRQLLAGGDVLSVNHVQKVLAQLPSCRLINGYGPTENTTFTCCHAVQASEGRSAVSVPIGRPITGTEVFVVDRHQRAVPVGVTGELVTGGAGLARGYLGRPALTAQKFVPSTLSQRPGSRLYQTGDLVRYQNGGAIEFVGRIDHQLKIRGFRVEIGEIENALTSHPAVRASVVVAQADVTAKRLVAYFVAESGAAPSTTQLRDYLRQRLPDYMVPAVFITLDSFPLTANGKVDRRALPAPDQSRPELESEFVAPREGIETQLAAIWSELLGVDPVGRHDNFFALGGHSLIGTQVISRIGQITRIELPLRCLFERPTVAGLAEWIETSARREHQDRRETVPLLPVSGDEPPMSFSQEGLWLLEQLVSGAPIYNIPAAIRLTGPLQVGALEQAVSEIRRRHEVLRTNFRTVDGRPVPTIGAASGGTAPIADLRGLAEDARPAAMQSLTRAEALRAFDLANDPLFRFSIVRSGESEHLMFVTMHHIVADGWSIGILIRELASLYESFCAGTQSPLEELTIQYRDFAHWQRRWQQETVLDEQLQYWRNALAGASTSLELPVDHPTASPPSYRGSVQSRVLRPELVNALETFGKEHGLTPFMIMLGALKILLARMTQQTDLVVGTVTSGRTRTEIEPLIGCFINFLPLRTKLSADETGHAVLQRVRTTVLDAKAHQECPFQKILEAVNPDRNSSQNPLFNVAFQLQNYPQSHFLNDSVEAEFQPPHRQISLLDLRFVATEEPTGTELSCEYSTDLFDGQTIDELLDAFCATLEKVVHEPDTRLRNFPVPEGLTVRAEPETVAIAATFTAEPVEESIAFWTDTLGAPFKTEFAPYGQVFQQLLSPDSLLNSNQKGLNVLLVRMEDWQRSPARLLRQVGPEEKERILAGHSRFTLPNRIEVAHLNRYETEYLYEEIFVDQVYLKHGIQIHDGDCIFDVGANIGLFTLFVHQKLRNATVHAFEPAPHTFEILRTNATLYGDRVHLHHCGVADRNTEATFTFYPGSSVFSSFHADAGEDTRAIRAVVLNSLENADAKNGALLEAFADEFLADRLASQEFTTQLRTISSVVSENNVDRIDLLKIDAEKSELAVLRGIDDRVWPIIKQIVIEVHDREGPVLAEVMSLLREHGFESEVEEEDALRGSGLYNIYATRPGLAAREPRSEATAAANPVELQRKVEELARALRAAVERTSTPYFVCLCPSSPATLADPDQKALHDRLEGLLASSLAGVTGVTLAGTKDLSRAYPVSNYYDRYGDELGHIPYTREFFAALGTSIARHVSATKGVPHKVIVLDCDQTLWGGICAEDGPEGIALDPGRRALQAFMVAQHDAGRLLCLCSKNSEADVFAVFDHRRDMPLRREHLVSWRINWRPKSENIKSLADELQLGLDSFVFLDDSSVECAEVRANCPEVLCLQIPQAAEQIPVFLHNVWAFDNARTTDEDKQRTRLYQQNAERERLREKTLTFADFLNELALEVRIDRMSPHQLPRVAQLTQRTNQFNVKKLSRSESELDAIFREADTECLTVDVADRFGDYGLVGVVIFKVDSNRIAVDTFLLSCRVLGRGVEHRMLARLGEIAAEQGLSHVAVSFKPTDRNQPALEFLNSVGARFKRSNGELLDFVFPATEARDVTFQPDTAATSTNVPADAETSRSVSGSNGNWISARLSRISAELPDVPRILKAIDDHKRVRVRSGGSTALVPPRTETQRLIAAIWEQLLEVDRVGIHEDFFELGGHSLLATQAISRLCDIFHVNLQLQHVFDAPTVSGLARIVDTARETDAGPAIPPVQPVPRRADLPLSFAQERLWFLDQFEPGSSLFNIPAALRLTGRLNTMALHQALQTIVNRHEGLRTTFPRHGDHAAQVVQPVERVSFQLVDMGGGSEEEVRRLAVEEAHRPFDLARGPLLRASLLQLSSDEFVILFGMHHIVSDGWSAGVLINEFSTLYREFVRGSCSTLPELPIQYADFAIWQRQWLEGPLLEAQMSYWKDQLEGAPPTLDLPTSRPRPPVRTYRGALATRVLPRALSDRLSRLARQERVTSFMTFLTAFQVLLSKYTGQGDVVVGTTIANRTRSELEGLIGFFANTLALRVDLADNPSFREALSRVRDVTLSAYAHQDLPFEKLVEAVQPVRDMSRTPVFQVAFELRDESVATLSLPELRVTPEPIAAVTSKYDLTLLLLEKDGEPARLSIEYSADLFEPSAMSRLLDHFEILLQAIVDDPGQSLSDLPLLNGAMQHQLLVEWNDTDVQLPDAPMIHRRFEARVREVPDAIAVIVDDQQLTYRELNAKANQLARWLQAAAVRPDGLVGIFMERSLEMVIGILGVLKAGGAYLPLDPSYPPERLRFMLEDSSATVILTQQRLRSQLPATSAVVYSMEEEWQVLSQRSGENAVRDVSVENLAYVIYTSGSTGRPKGAMLEHRAIANHMNWMCREFPLRPGDAVLQKTPISFDASVWEFYAPLLSGARLVLARPGGQQDPDYLLGAIEQYGVTTLQVVPSLLRMLLEHADEGRGASLQRLFCGGEALTTELRERFFARFDAELHNLYGPTETCIESIAWRCDRHGAEPTVPIGRPIDNTRVYLLDSSLRPTPIGVAGEVHIAGLGVGRGYLNRPDLTADRFIPDPFWTESGRRFYKAGDLARYQPDATIEFLGRSDHQTKIRGFRIELGEIEAVLRQQPAVRDAVVVVREDTPGDQRLVAYFAPSSSSAASGQELRQALQTQLPDYMVPSSFVQLEALPLTANGKVDRRALPAPSIGHTDQSYVAPTGDREKRLTDIFAEVLGVNRVGVHDNFFEIGGHSLLATKVVSRVRDAFGARVPLRRIFECPTVAELAKSLQEEEVGSGSTPGPDMPPLERTPGDGPLPLSFAQQRLWFLDNMEPGNPYYNMPAALRLSGDVRVSALERAIDEIIRRHEVLQASYVLLQGQPRQVRTPGRGPVLRIVDVSSLDEASREEQVRLLAAADARQPFDLSAGRVVRATLIKCDEDSHTILFAMHHIVSDGWSLAIVVRELSVLYEAFCEGRPSPLAEVPIQYADFAVWQRKWLESDGLKSQLAYWKAQLGGQLPTVSIRTDRPRPAIETFRGADEIDLIPNDVIQALNRLSTRENVTLFMTLVAAYKTLLYRNIGQDDIVVGTDLAGRNRAELERLVGFFVNLLVLRSDLSGNPTFRQLLARVRETAMGAFANQDVPFDRLVEELQPKRHRSRTPLFQMLFVMENIPLETLRLPGLTMTPMSNQANTARFDLALFVREQEAGLVTKWTYKTDLFDRSTIHRLANQYRALLENIAAAPDTRLKELELRTQEEIRHQALEEDRQRDRRMSTLLPGRRRARTLSEKSGEADANGADTQKDEADVDTEKQVRTP